MAKVATKARKGRPKLDEAKERDKFEVGRSTIQVAVLGLLQTGERCGYRIAKELRDANPDLKMHYGVLYPLLERMERNGYVVGRWEHGRGMKGLYVYKLQPAGKKALAVSQARWLKIVNQVRAFAAGKA